jgi:hypothetical protein
MLTAALLSLSLLVSPLERCASKPLSVPARRLVTPFLKALSGLQDPYRQSSGSLEAQFDKSFKAILKDESAGGDEAVAYLLTIYVGEATGEELTCEGVNRRARIVKHLQVFTTCTPELGDEQLQAAFPRDPTKGRWVLERIAKGEKSCELP